MMYPFSNFKKTLLRLTDQHPFRIEKLTKLRAFEEYAFPVIVKKHIYTFLKNTESPSFKRYTDLDKRSLKMTQLANPPRGRFYPCVVSYADLVIFAIGGSNPRNMFDRDGSVDMYTIASDKWSNAPTLNTARAHL